MTTCKHGRPAAIGPAGTPTFSGANVIDNPQTDRLIHAPWSADQVTALNAFQHHGHMHPFTCGALHASGQSPVLVATNSGWVCPDPQCVYRQDWAHAFMADPAVLPAVPVPPTTHATDRAAVLERVRDLHQPMQRGPFTICAHCSGWDGKWRCLGVVTDYPCATLRALDGEVGVELRRMADEAQQQESPGLRCVCGDPVQLMDDSDPTSWIHGPGSDTPCLEARPACPDPIECSHEAALGQARQEVRRLGLMVDEYGAGASALTTKLKRARDMHRETCPWAQGKAPSPAFRCGMCDVLDAPAMPVRQPASGPGRVADEEQPETSVRVGGNAEDCPACHGTNPPYPFICPGPGTGSAS